MGEKIKVLIVDDEEIVRISMEEYLLDEGFEVYSSVSGEDALEIIAKNHIDIGIIDMRLPGIDGNTLIEKAKKIRPKIKCIIHTGSIGYSVPNTLQDLGVKEEQVFKKPIKDLKKFIEILKSLV